MNFTINGSTWGDVFVDGPNRIGCVYDLGIDIAVDFYAIVNGVLKKRDSMLFNFTEKVLFARGDRNNRGDILVMGQGATTGKFRLKSSRGSYDPPNPLVTFGTNVCDLQPIDGGFRYVVQTDKTRYYDSLTQTKFDIPGLSEGTSQGIIQLIGTDIHWSDLWRTMFPQMLYPFIASDIAIGEGATDPAHIQAFDSQGQKNIFNGIAERPRACYDTEGNIFAVASRGPNGVTFNFYNLPLPNLHVDPIPIPIPEPEPKPEEPTPMEQLADKVKNTLRRFFDKFPLVKGEDNIRRQVIKAAEQVAFEFPNDGYGTKRSANGHPVTKDGIAQINRGNKLYSWDIVNGAGTDNPTLNLDNPQFHDITGQVFIGDGDFLDGGEIFTPRDHLFGTPIPEPIPNPKPNPTDPTPLVPPQNIIQDSMNALRIFCQNYSFQGNKHYAADEIHESGLFISDGLIYFMMSDTGNWAKVLMNPTDKRSWDEKRKSADLALQTYMKRRVGDNS